MNYRSIRDLSEDIKHWIPELPGDLDLIVGIPRSGLLVANILALHLNLPFADVAGLGEGKILETGYRYDKEIDLSERRKILVVDDSMLSGKQMKKVKDEIELAHLPHQIYFGALYITAKSYKQVDFCYRILDAPRVFEWNLFHHPILKESCVDIDGFLCRDPTSKENDDGKNYKNFLINVKPFIRTSVEIGWLVTCRLEKYRDLTEKWLHKHNIKYRSLVMMDLPDKRTRIALGGYASFKAEVYESSGAILFIESSLNQAQSIVDITGKSVLCTDTGEMINASFLKKTYNKRKTYLTKFKKEPFGTIIRLVRILKRKYISCKMKVIINKNKRNKDNV